MSSVGQAVGGIVGGVIGWFVGGPSGAMYGISIGSGIGGLLDPPKGPTLLGPRLSDLSVQTSTYGANLPHIHGTVATHGNVFWLENDQIKETPHKKKSGGKGGGGSTQKTWTYSATFAVGLCSTRETGAIVGVRRIWVAGDLFYDAGSGDVETIIASNQAAETFRVYRGTDDQMPDPRMQADKGVANTPAYRGRAYIVFYDLSLEAYGRSLMGAQVKVEVVGAGSGAGWSRIVTVEDTGKEFAASLSGGGDGIGVAYIKTVDSGVITVGMLESTTVYKFGPDGQYFGAATAEEIAQFDDDPPFIACGFMGDGRVFVQPSVTPAEDVALKFVDSIGVEHRLDSEIDQAAAIDTALISNDGETVLVISAGAPQSWAVINQGGEIQRSGLAGASAVPGGYYARGGRSYFAGSYDQDSGLVAFTLGASSGQTSVFQIDDNDVLQEIDSGLSLSYFSFTYPTVYVTDGVVYAFSRSHFNVFAEGAFTPSLVLLSDIVETEALTAKSLSSSDINVTALTSEVRGYRVTQTGAIRAAIEPLQAAWPFDVIQSGYKIKAVVRGGSSVATIDVSELDARPAGETPGPQITVAREMDTQLPSRVTIKHLDIGREYDQGEQYAERLSTESISVRDMDMPISLSAGEAATKAEVLLYLYWMERHTIQFRLPPEYLALEPADVITVTAPNATYELRLTSINYLSDSRLECVARYNSAALYTPAALGEEGLAPPATISLAGPSAYALMDLPALTADMDESAYVAAMTGYTSGWPGGILFRSADGGQTWDDVQGFSGKGTMGSARNTIPSAPSGTVDAASVLQVDLLSGELESVTELAMLNGANHFAYGADGRWEIIAARTRTLQADGSVLLQDMLRGRFGTEHNTGNHAVGDAVVLLNDPDNALIGMDSAAIGLSRLYRGITAGRSIDSDTERAFTYRAVNLEPLSPVHLRGSRHPSTNDWTLAWVRRTRVGGEWRDYVDASVSEAAEAYEVDVYADDSYSTVVRTLSSASPTVEYSSAEQVTDFGSVQIRLYVSVYQISATVGRGYPLTGRVTTLSTGSMAAVVGDVPSLLHFETDLTDEAGLSWSAAGDAAVSTDDPIVGAGSLLLPGGSYIQTTEYADFNFGQDPFTIEMLVRPTAFGAGRGLFARRVSGVYCPLEIALQGPTSSQIRVLVGNATMDGWQAFGEFDTVEWLADRKHHLAVCGDGSFISVYVKGIKSATTLAYTEIFGSTQNAYLGRGGDGAVFASIDEFRVIRGQALYTEDFEPPIGAFANP